MKRIFITSAIIGLLAVPSLALAANKGTDNSPLSTSGEDRLGTTALVAPQNENNGVEVDDNVALPAGSISIDQARTAALGVFPDKTISKIETELEDGIVVFSVRFTDGSRVDVRASDGTVLRTEPATAETVNSGRGQ